MKAGEASVSAAAADVSETNAASSATAAADSANVASAAQTAAEAACEETKKVAVLPATTTSRGSVMPDGLTISVTADGVITVKDVAIGGDLGDLASARGQVGDARQLADLDFNMLTVPGFYRTTGNPKNGPIGISGASIGSLFVSGMQGNGNRLFQIMVSGNGIYWRTSISGGTTWEIWNQVLTGNKIGDGIRNTNGIISVPEMQGATSAQAGVSGLVPPPLAADAGKVLGSDGTWSFPKDVAIGGDLEDLASARGIFDTLTKGSVDCNTLTEQGVYAVSLAGTVNGPGFLAKLVVFNGKGSAFTNQMAIASGVTSSGSVRVAYRAKNSEDIWSPWSEGILSGRIGDGITVNNGIISAPEYEGATASTAGTSGLVPPAAAGQHESFLTGGGEYKPALTTISDSVELSDSTTAASAKAVKKVYDDVPSMAAHAAMPRVDRFIYIVFTGGRYTAPEDGYIAVNKAAGSGQFERMRLEVVDGNDNMIYGTTSPGAYDSQQVLCWLPVSKGAKVKVMDDLSGPWVYAHFIYANGAA